MVCVCVSLDGWGDASLIFNQLFCSMGDIIFSIARDSEAETSKMRWKMNCFSEPHSIFWVFLEKILCLLQDVVHSRSAAVN